MIKNKAAIPPEQYHKNVSRPLLYLQPYFVYFVKIWDFAQRGLVKKIEDYIYSSASNYINNEGLVEVELAEMPKVDVSKESSFIKYLS